MKISLNPEAKATSALSLVEVLVAATIAAIILTSLYLGIATNFTLLATTRQNLRATQIMVSKLEAIRLCRWSDDQLFNPDIVPPTFTDSYYPQGIFGNNTNTGVNYYGTITVDTNLSTFQATFSSAGTVPSYQSAMAVVTVTLNWTNGFGDKVGHHRTMSTLVAEYGIQNYVANY
ncbi:MAG TPA: hypothetical protein VFV23_10295 [Verrucomicrobiae bacterium]|nr:hypothetical protein [Verrucomicrobiae bacterium]